MYTSSIFRINQLLVFIYAIIYAQGTLTMNKTITIPEIKLIGIKGARTNNTAEFIPETNTIGATMHRYFEGGIFNTIPNRVAPMTTYAVYFDYASDYNGDFSYFIGEAVSSFDDIPQGLDTLIIPAQTYTVFTTQQGPLPYIVIDEWQKIWNMPNEELGGERAYIADFELYDHRCVDYQNAIADIYIGIKK